MRAALLRRLDRGLAAEVFQHPGQTQDAPDHPGGPGDPVRDPGLVGLPAALDQDTDSRGVKVGQVGQVDDDRSGTGQGDLVINRAGDSVAAATRCRRGASTSGEP
jgi:hypothetical protein